MANIDFSSFFGGASNFYSDYASIRNGSYKRLKKSYYAQYFVKGEYGNGDKQSSQGYIIKLNRFKIRH